jgi:hypothetical protein
MSRRPWRIVATITDWTSPTGARVAGHTAACTEAGLARFREEHTAAGHAVTVWQVLPLVEESEDTADAGALAG